MHDGGGLANGHSGFLNIAWKGHAIGRFISLSSICLRVAGADSRNSIPACELTARRKAKG